MTPIANHNLDILIIGAGLGGLAASISCALAGHSVRIVESAKELTEVGAGLQITPNGARLLEHWKLLAGFWDTVAEPTALSVHRYTGETLWREDNFDRTVRRRYNAPFVDVHRADLQQALYNRAKELGVQLILGERVEKLDLELDQPLATTASGKQYQADLIVAADGLWSRCRAIFLDDVNDKPIPTGDLAYRVVLRADQLDQDEDLRKWVSEPEVHFWIGPGAHAVGYSLRAGEEYNIVLLVPDTLPPDVSREAGSVEDMLTLFKDWDPILTRFLGHVKGVDRWKLMHHEEMKHWVNDRANIVFLGDACHSMLPYLAQGANSSLEDGAVLGTLLAKLKDRSELPACLRTYERLRKSRGDTIARETFKQRLDFHMNDGEEQRKRDIVLAAGPDSGKYPSYPSRWTCPQVQPWLYGYDAISDATGVSFRSQSKLGCTVRRPH